MLPAQQLPPISPWPPDAVLDRMDDLAHKGKGNGDYHLLTIPTAILSERAKAVDISPYKVFPINLTRQVKNL